MTCFDLLKAILDKTAMQLFGQTALTEEQGKIVEGHLKSMSDTLNNGGAPDYTDPIRRFAYLYCYPGAHAHLFEIACNASNDVRNLLKSKLENSQPLRVCFFGGGPGTEVVGLAKFISRRVYEDQQLEVDVLVADREAAWTENAVATMECVSEALKHSGVKVTFAFQYEQFDFCAGMAVLPEQVSGRDLYAFNYSISEVARRDDALSKLFKSIAEGMPEGAVVVITDREEKELVEVGRKLIESAGLTITEQLFGRRYMEGEEQCQEIKDAYFQHIKRSPRVQFGKEQMNQGAFWLVGTKNQQ